MAVDVRVAVGVLVLVGVREGMRVDVGTTCSVCNAALSATEVEVRDRDERCETRVHKIAPNKRAITPPVPRIA